MQADDTLFGIVKNGVLTLSGYAISVTVDASQLRIKDGFKGAETVLEFPRATCPVSRIISLRSEGYISFAAVRWLTDAGVSLVHLNYDGTPLLTTVPTPRSPVLSGRRRAQATLANSARGKWITYSILNAKIRGQIALLRDLGRSDAAAAAADYADRLSSRLSLSDLLGIEGVVSALYWRALADFPVSFGRRQKVPQYWRAFGSRSSALTGTPRNATTPGNAMLNYLYGVAVSEIIIALHARGLDPFIGLLHADETDRERASLAYDLMEPARSAVDRWFFNWLREATFSNRDFREGTRGAIRIMRPLNSHLAMTAALWRGIADELAQWFYARLSGDKRELRLPPIDMRGDAGRRAARWQVGNTIVRAIPTTCLECGKTLAHRRRKFCSEACKLAWYGGPIVEAGLAAIAQARAAGKPSHPRRAAIRVEGVPSLAEWRQKPGWSPAADTEMKHRFVTEILPRLASVQPKDIRKALGVGVSYSVAIRNGRVTPHPRFHLALAQLAGLDLSD